MKTINDDALKNWLIDAEQILDDEEEIFVEDKKLRSLYNYFSGIKVEHSKPWQKELIRINKFLHDQPEALIVDYQFFVQSDNLVTIELIKEWVYRNS